jgi:GNAT superfamily N-acetyltransferase
MWFALLSGEEEAELNVCGLLPGATAASAAELTSLIDAVSLPAIIFVSEFADRATGDHLAAEGYETAEVEEPLMRSNRPPSPIESGFTARPAADAADIAAAIALTSEAHAVGRELLERTFATATKDPLVRVWLAFDGEEPVSVAWLARHGEALGVKEMMTPPRHQRRGAGRAVLVAALAAEWTPETLFSYLIATPAGRRLYESIGYTAVDRVKTRHRGLSPAVLAAIGQST